MLNEEKIKPIPAPLPINPEQANPAPMYLIADNICMVNNKKNFLHMTNMNKIYNFTGDWIAGFTQSDGSFVVGFETQSGKLSIRPRPMFILTQSYTEFEMFKALHSYLGVGRLQKNRNNVTLIVTSINEIISRGRSRPRPRSVRATPLRSAGSFDSFV